MLALNRSDRAEQIRSLFQQEKLTFTPILGRGPGGSETIGRAYGVRTYPTTYVLGPDRRVLWAGVGFRPQDLRAAVHQAMARLPGAE